MDLYFTHNTLYRNHIIIFKDLKNNNLRKYTDFFQNYISKCVQSSTSNKPFQEF